MALQNSYNWPLVVQTWSSSPLATSIQINSLYNIQNSGDNWIRILELNMKLNHLASVCVYALECYYLCKGFFWAGVNFED
jgi:hypothetical protein